MRRILAAAVLTAALTPLAAHAQSIISVRNPANGCTYSVWGPDIIMGGGPKPSIVTHGGFGEGVSCP